MAEVLRLRSRGPQAVEEVWQRFVPSARLHRVDPRTFAFEWTSVETPGFSLVGYELAADVQSEIAPSDQLMACRVDSPGSRVGTERHDFDASMPWLFSDTAVRAKWKDSAQVRAFVFDLAGATATARQISGDDRLVLKVLGAEPLSRSWARRWEAL